MKDFIGNEINVGDYVVYAKAHGKNAGASLGIGRIKSISKVMVGIESFSSILYCKKDDLQRKSADKVTKISNDDAEKAWNDYINNQPAFSASTHWKEFDNTEKCKLCNSVAPQSEFHWHYTHKLMHFSEESVCNGLKSNYTTVCNECHNKISHNIHSNKTAENVEELLENEG